MEVLKHFDTQRFDIVQKSLWISSNFDTENCTWRLTIVQNFSCLIFLGHFFPKYILENL